MSETVSILLLFIPLMLVEYFIIDMYYFNRELNLRRDLQLRYMDDITRISKAMSKLNDNVEISIEKRITCPVCGYPMRILEETDDQYQCYCADCKVDKIIPKKHNEEIK